MSTIQQELVIKARADVANAKQGLASLDQSVDGLASAQEGLKTASNDAAQGLAAEASAAQAAAQEKAVCGPRLCHSQPKRNEAGSSMTPVVTLNQP